MIIVYCLDATYVPLAEISISTVKKHNPNAKIVIVSEKPIQVRGADEYYIWNLGGMHRNRGVGDRISNAAYLKLMLPKLPYDKVIFLDGDTLCQHPLDELWNMPVPYIGLCESHTYGEQQSKDLRIAKYGLSGMMVLNLKNLREKGFTEKAFEMERKIPTPKTGWFHEETIINTCFWNLLTFLPIKFNYCFHREYRNPIDYNDAVILHICGKDKSFMSEYVRCQKHYPELGPIRQNIKGKKVAIVGNAKSIFDTKYGNEIDDHEFIIRFNHGVPKVKESQGTKTDMVMLACTLSDEEIKQYNASFLVNRSGNYYNRLANFTIGNRERAIMASGIGAQPSTGFMAVNICLYFGAKSIDLYGFDWGNTKTFYNPEDYKTQHNYQKEKEIMIGYEVNGLINIKKGAENGK